MTKVEKILILLFLVAAVAMKLIGQLDLGPDWLHSIAIILTITTLLGICNYYLTQTKTSIYSLAFIMLALHPLGGLFKSMHWPGAGPILVIGLVTSLLVAGLLIKTGFQYFKNKTGEVTLNFIIAALLIGQFLLTFLVFFKDYQNNVEHFNYFILAAILLTKIKGSVLKLPESRVLTVVALQTTLFIISDMVDLIK